MILKNSEYDASLNASILKARADFYCLDNYTSKIKFSIDKDVEMIISNYEVLKKYENILLENSVFTEIKDEFLYRPEYLSHSLYGTVHLWYMILFLNRMKNNNEFDKKQVRVLHPENLNILNEIYSSEKEYINDLLVDSSNLMLKSLKSKSDSLLKPPNFVIGSPVDSMNPNPSVPNDGNMGFEDMKQYNVGRQYLIKPQYCTPSDGLLYNGNRISGSIISRKNQIISIKPMYISNNGELFINGNLSLRYKDNTSDVNLVNSLQLKTLNKVIYNKYELVESISDYKVHLNSMLVKVSGIPVIKDVSADYRKVKVTLIYEAGSTSVVRPVYNTSTILPVDISQNYGDLISVNITVLGNFSDNDQHTIQTAYILTNFDYINIVVNENDYIDIEFRNNNSKEIFHPMISYNYRDYKYMSKDDLVVIEQPNDLGLIPTTTTPTNIIINNLKTFKGLQLISMIDNHELEDLDLFENHLQDVNSIPLKDARDKLLLYETYATTNKKIDDYYISCSIACANNLVKENGSMGIFVKGQVKLVEDVDSGLFETKSYCYLYMLKMNNEYYDKNKSTLSGLYKVDTDLPEIIVDSDGYSTAPLKKIADTPQRITGNRDYNTFIKIVTNGNNIKVYDVTSNSPIIDYYDTDEIKFDVDEQPSFGIALFNVNQPSYTNLKVMGKVNN